MPEDPRYLEDPKYLKAANETRSTIRPRREGGKLIRAPQDFYGGLVLIALAAFALYASKDLSGMQGNFIGPGTAPYLFAGLLMAFGIAIMMMGVLFEGPDLERWSLRGIIVTTASILVFAATIRPLGLVVSTYLTFLVTAAASAEVRWREAVIAGMAMSAGCALLFVGILKLPFSLWPQL